MVLRRSRRARAEAEVQIQIEDRALRVEAMRSRGAGTVGQREAEQARSGNAEVRKQAEQAAAQAFEAEVARLRVDADRSLKAELEAARQETEKARSRRSRRSGTLKTSRGCRTRRTQAAEDVAALDAGRSRRVKAEAEGRRRKSSTACARKRPRHLAQSELVDQRDRRRLRSRRSEPPRDFARAPSNQKSHACRPKPTRG